MVCIPCIVIPVLLWVFHKYIQPFILKFWNPWEKKGVKQGPDGVPAGVDTTSEEYKFIQEKTQGHPVMVFSKKDCSFCNMAKTVLDEIGVSYDVEDIGTRDNCEALQSMFQKITGARSVPRVYVGGKCIGGGSETWSMHNQGKLVPMLKEANATFKKED